MTTERDTIAAIIGGINGDDWDDLPEMAADACRRAADALLAAGVRTGEAVAQMVDGSLIQRGELTDAQMEGDRLTAELAEARAVIAAVSAGVAALAEEWRPLIDQGSGAYLNPRVVCDRLAHLLTDPAATLAAIRAEAWDRGVDAAFRGAIMRQNGEDVKRINPYRADRIEGGA